MPRPQKILFINHVSALGGAERSLLVTLGALDRRQFEPVALLPEPGPLGEQLAKMGIAVHYLPLRRFRKTGNPFTLAGHLLNVRGVVRQLVRLIRQERIDLLHANSNTAQLYAGPAARRAGIPCVWHCRDLAELGALGRWMFSRASAVIAISETVRRHLMQDGPAEKIVTIMNGIDADAFEREAAGGRVRAEWGIPENAFLIGMAAQMAPWKNHALFIRAAARMATAIPEARFLIAGGNRFGDSPAYEAGLRALARELGLGERLIFAGHREEMSAVLAGLDLLIHPAEREPLGRVILEAMALGKPVVAVQSGGPAEIIRSGRDGLLVPPNDPATLAEAALTLWRDRTLAARLGAEARRRIRRDFAPGPLTERLAAVYRRLLPEHGSVKVAYVLAVFPSISETFILRELMALEEKGMAVSLFALQRPTSTAVHPEAHPFVPTVNYRPSAGSWSGWATGLYFLNRAPGRLLALLNEALRRGDPETGSRPKALYHLLTALTFAREAARDRVEHVHAHFAYVPADIGAAMARLLDVPFSLSIHAWDIWTRAPAALARRLAPAVFVAVCTEQGRRQVKALCPCFPDDRLLLLRHGVVPGLYPPTRDTEPLLLGVGRLEEKKGFRHLIEACRILKAEGVPFRCVIVGEGPRRQDLESAIAEHGVAREVILAGERTQDQLMELYGRARILVVPSVIGADGDRDGLPNVLIEAMAMRIPVVATTVSAIPEVIVDGVQGLLVNPGDPRMLADALTKLLADKNARERMGGMGRETMCRDFDISRNVERMVELFSNDGAKERGSGRE